ADFRAQPKTTVRRRDPPRAARAGRARRSRRGNRLADRDLPDQDPLRREWEEERRQQRQPQRADAGPAAGHLYVKGRGGLALIAGLEHASAVERRRVRRRWHVPDRQSRQVPRDLSRRGDRRRARRRHAEADAADAVLLPTPDGAGPGRADLDPLTDSLGGISSLGPRGPHEGDPAAVLWSWAALESR